MYRILYNNALSSLYIHRINDNFSFLSYNRISVFPVIIFLIIIHNFLLSVYSKNIELKYTISQLYRCYIVISITSIYLMHVYAGYIYLYIMAYYNNSSLT